MPETYAQYVARRKQEQKALFQRGARLAQRQALLGNDSRNVEYDPGHNAFAALAEGYDTLSAVLKQMQKYKIDPARHMQTAMELPLEDKAASRDELDDLVQHNGMTGTMYRNVKTAGFAPYHASHCQKPSRSCDREDLNKTKVAKMLGVSAARLTGFGAESANGMLFTAATSDARGVFDRLRCRKGSTSGLTSSSSVLIKVQAIEHAGVLQDVKNESAAQMEVYAKTVKPNAEMPTIHGSEVVPRLYFSGLVSGPEPRCASWVWVMDRVPGKPFRNTPKIGVRQYASLERSLASLWMLGYAHCDAHDENVLYDSATDHTWVIDLGAAVRIPQSLVSQLCRYYTVHTSALRAWQVIRAYVNTARHTKARRFDPDDEIGGVRIADGDRQLYTYNSDGALLLELWMRTTGGDIRQARFSGWLDSQTRYTSAPASVHRLIAALKGTRTRASRAHRSRAPSGKAKRRSKSRKVVRKASPARAAKLKCKKDKRRACSASSRERNRYTRKELVDTLKRCYGVKQYDRDGRRRDMDSLCRSFARLST